MADKFEKILSNKIKDSLEHHTIPYDPNSWEKLKAKKNNKKKRLGFWLWRVASVLVVMLLSGLFINYFVDINNEENNFKQKVNKEELIPNSSKDSIQIPQQQFVAEAVDSITNKSNIKLQKKFKRPLNSNTNSQNNIAINTIVENTKDSNNNIESEASKIETKTSIENNKPIFSSVDKDSLVNNNKLIKKMSDSLLDNLNLLLENNSIKAEKPFLDKRLKMGVLISSSYNMHDTKSSNDIGVSSGLSLEIPISHKVELFLGAIYSNQSFNILNQSNNLSDAYSAKGNNIILKSRAASVSSIEIPFNLKYNFKVNKRKLFISTGISSVQYFNEKIENTFLENKRSKTTGKDNSGNNFVQYELTQTENSVESSIDSNKFELLGSLNFSAGILIPITNTNQSLIIEPYFKYSLSTITSQNVNYSNLGIQFRYNFSFKK